MAIYGFLDVLLGFLTVFTTAETFASFIVYWQPLFDEVRETCRDGLVHPRRRRLLWLIALTPVIWILTAVIYLRNLIALWYLMASVISDGFPRRIVYTLLDSCLFLLVLCGLGGLYLTGLLFYDGWEEVKDICMIMNFRGENCHAITDLENQRAPTQNYHAVSNFEDRRSSTEESSDVDSARAPGSLDTRNDRLAGQVLHHRASRPRRYDPFHYPQYPTPSQILSVRNVDPVNVHSPTNGQESAPCPIQSSAPVTFPNFDSDGDTIESTPSSPSTDGNEDDKRQPSFDFDSLCDVSPRPTSSPTKDDEALESDKLVITDEAQLRRKRCHSSSSEHTYSLQSTRRASVRQPLTAASPTGPFGSNANTALDNVHCGATWWERNQLEPSRPTGRVLPGKALSYNKVEPEEHASSEHASIQQVLERIITDTKTNATKGEITGQGRPDPIRNISFEVHTAVDDEALLDEVNEALHDLEQRNFLEQEGEQHFTTAQARQKMTEEANDALRKLQLARQRRLNNPYLNGRHYTVHGRQLPPATSPPLPMPVRVTSSQVRGMKLNDPYGNERRSYAPLSRLPPIINREPGPVRSPLHQVPPLTRIENWRRDVPRRKVPKLTLVIPEPEHGIAEGQQE